MRRYKPFKFEESTFVPFEKLKQATKQDIVEELQSIYNDFLNRQYFRNDEEKIEFIEDTIDLPKLEIKKVKPELLYKQFKNRKTSDLIVDTYKQMILKGIEFDPVIISGNKFLDGGHRVRAYYELDKDYIPAIDIKPILEFEWTRQLADIMD